MYKTNIVALLLFLTFVLFSAPVRALEVEVGELEASYDWASNFTSDAGISPTSYFGAYVFHEFNNELYIGMGRGRPADTDGALLLKYNGTTVTTIGELDEQGVNEITSVSDRVVIGGADPAYADDWTLGNVYVSTGSGMTKYRTGNGLTNVIHMWGIHADGDNLYAAVSSHDGTNPSTCVNGVDCFGEVYKSTNKGATWTKLATVGDYRVFDVSKFNTSLYANYVNAVDGDSKLAYSSNDGANWTNITLPAADGRRTHFVEFDSKLLMLGGGTLGNKIYSISSDNVVTQYDLPFSVGHLYGDATYFSNYNQFVVANGYLYAIDRTGGIRRTTDLTNWELVADTAYTLISIGYWPSQNKLVFSDTGTTAKLYALDLDTVMVSVSGISASIDVIDVSSGLNTETPSSQFTGANRTVRLQSSAGIGFAEVAADLTTDRNWTGVLGEVSQETGASFAHNLTSQAGTATTYSLLVPIPSRSEASDVVVCPSASSLAAVSEFCIDAVRFKENETKAVGSGSGHASKTKIGDRWYWRISGLTGTGAIDVSPRTASDDSGGETPGPSIAADEGGIIENDNVAVIVASRTAPFDIDVLPVTTAYDRPISLSGYWQVSQVQEIWLRSHFNGARVYDQKKSSIVALKYQEETLTVDGSWYASEFGLRLAVSRDEGKTWKLIKQSVVDPVNNTVAAIDQVGGLYIVVSKPISTY